MYARVFLGAFVFYQASDVWSLGVCVFLILTRRLPFWVTSDESDYIKVMSLAELVENEDPYIPAYIPSSMRATLAELLHKHPRYRMTLRQAMRNEWISGSCMRITGHHNDQQLVLPSGNKCIVNHEISRGVGGGHQFLVRWMVVYPYSLLYLFF